MERRSTVEMKALIQKQRDELLVPPPAPAGTTLREWFAGLAIANIELMKDIDRARYGEEATRIADQLISSLATPRQPTLQSMAALSEEKMKEWDAALAIRKEDEATAEAREAKATVPNMPRVRTIPSKRSPTMLGVAAPANPPEGYVPPQSAKPASQPQAIGRLASIQAPAPPTEKTQKSKTTSPGRYSVVELDECITIPLVARKA